MTLSSPWMLLVVLGLASSCTGDLDVLYEWKYIDYVWKSDAHKAEAIACGQYDYTKIITNDVQEISDGRVLVTTPKYYDNPATLSTVSSTTGDGGPLLAPYPDWSWHKKAGDCSGITSVNRVKLDKCNRLWVVDSGKIGNTQVCPARIFVFNAETDELLQKIEIPDDLTYNPDDPTKGRIEMQAAETVGDNCEQTWAYIGDPEGWGLVIYNGTSLWRLNGERFAPDAGESNFTIAGESITLNNGVASLVILPEGFVKDEYLIFKPMASVKGYSASTEQLHNSYSGIEIQYYMTNSTVPSQELARDYSSDGILIAGFPTETAIACWNLQYPLVDPYVEFLAQDSERLQFISGLKITIGTQNNVEGEHVWVMSNRYQAFVLGSMDFSEVNFRVLGADVGTLVNGTYCQSVGHEIVDTIVDKFFLPIEE